MAFSSSIATAGSNGRLILTQTDGGGAFTGTGNEYQYLYGLQCESFTNVLQTKPTSYIPTTGTPITRPIATLDNGGDNTLINSIEGVFYAELKPDLYLDEDMRISLTDGSTGNRIHMQFPSGGELIKIFSFGSATNKCSTSTALHFPEQINKIALKYAVDDYAIWVNGVKVFEGVANGDGTTFPAGTLSQLEFDQGNGGSPYKGLIKRVAIYDQKLTDRELECLTS